MLSIISVFNMHVAMGYMKHFRLSITVIIDAVSRSHGKTLYVSPYVVSGTAF